MVIRTRRMRFRSAGVCHARINIYQLDARPKKSKRILHARTTSVNGLYATPYNLYVLNERCWPIVTVCVCETCTGIIENDD